MCNNNGDDGDNENEPLRACYLQGTILRALHLILRTTLGSKYYFHPNCTGGKTEVQRG